MRGRGLGAAARHKGKEEVPLNLLFATGNLHKVEEAEEILGDEYEVEQLDVEYPELQSDDLGTIAEEGARWVFDHVEEPVFVEDSGLFVDALRGFPGPYSSYAYSTIGNRGILRLLDEERSAVFRSVVAYADDGGVSTFVGEVRGEIARRERGEDGFGYDPVFVPEGSDMTFAQDLSYKNRVSHRRRALEGFSEWLRNEGPGSRKI